MESDTISVNPDLTTPLPANHHHHHHRHTSQAEQVCPPQEACYIIDKNISQLKCVLESTHSGMRTLEVGGRVYYCDMTLQVILQLVYSEKRNS
jgi:hypothetical protein